MLILYSVVVLLAVIFTGHVDGFGTGAPPQACSSMTPGHNSQGSALSPQSSSSPYSLAVSASSYSAGTPLTVSVNGAAFGGILLQARQPGQTTPIGTFTSPPANTKLNQCTSADDCITHSAQTDKSDGTSFTWNPPVQGVGNIEFVVTVAQNHDVYWIGIKSNVITDGDATATASTEANTGTTVAPTMVPTEANGADGITAGRTSCLIIIFNIVMVALFI